MNDIMVYIACPYTKGDVAMNVARSMDATEELFELGFVPFNPLYTHFQHMKHPRPYSFWLEYDLKWLLSCTCLLRLDGESNGADKEIEVAKDFGIPVFYSIDDLKKHYGIGEKR